MKNKKIIVIVSLLVMLLVFIFVTTLFLIFKDKFNDKKEEKYIAYVDINPLVKLSFKVSCQKDECSEPIVIDTELINEDAKKIYKDLVLKDKTLKETIELLGNTVKDNEIAFNEVHIYTNYDKKEDFEVESTDYELILDVKNDKDLEQSINELIKEKENTIEKEIIILIAYPKKVSEMPFEFQVFPDDCRKFDFIEYPELYVSSGQVKVTISGPIKLIDSLPDSVSTMEEAIDFIIQAIIEVNDYTLGEHETYLNITSQNPDIKILSPTSIKIKYEIRKKYDIHFCYYIG